MKKIIIFVFVIFLALSLKISGDSYSDGELLIVPQGEVISTGGGISSNIGFSSYYFNPALISNLTHKFVLNTGYFSGIFPGNEIHFINLATTISKLYLYLGYQGYGNTNIVLTDADGNIINSSYNVPGNNLFKIGLSYELFKNFNVGIIYKNFDLSLPPLNANIDNHDYNSSFLSIGVVYKIKFLNFGLSFKNILLSSDLAGYGDNGSVNLSVGTALFNKKLNINLLLSTITRAQQDSRVAAGLEYNIKNFIFLRLGYARGINNLSSGIFPGIGIKYKFFRLDYTFSFGEIATYHYLSATFGLKSLSKGKKVVKKKHTTTNDNVPVVKKYPKPAKKILVAVLDFEGKNITSSDAGIITDFIRQDMINSGYFTVLERSAIKSILKEVNFQQSGCTSAECAVQIGKVLAVRKMVVGSVSKLGKKYFITLRMVDVETSQIDVATSVGAAVPIEDLPSYVNKLVDQMIESINNNKK